MKLFWRIILLIFVALVLLSIGFVIGFFKGETVYNYVIAPPFCNTKGLLDWSIIWVAVTGIGTLVLASITVAFSVKSHYENKALQVSNYISSNENHIESILRPMVNKFTREYGKIVNMKKFSSMCVFRYIQLLIYMI